MLIKILKNEQLFSEAGTHICDSRGIAIRAEENTECEVSEEHVERVISILSNERAAKGLDANGNPIVIEQSTDEVALDEELVEDVVADEKESQQDILEPNNSDGSV